MFELPYASNLNPSSELICLVTRPEAGSVCASLVGGKGEDVDAGYGGGGAG